MLEDTLVDIARVAPRRRWPTYVLEGRRSAAANARILAEAGFDRVFLPPAPGDAGCALGAALYAGRLLQQPDRERLIILSGVHPSMPTSRARGARGQPGRGNSRAHWSSASPGVLPGHVVGWMDGVRVGPRAAAAQHPCGAARFRIRDRLNRDIKRREFRPFAPVSLGASYRFFDLPPGGSRLGRYMSGVFRVRPEWRSRLAAVTHADGSARVQVLERDMAPRLHALLEVYGRRTGIPVLLNTSFNVAGEPIVTQALEGYMTFRRCGLDALVAGSIVVTKPGAAEARSSRESGAWSSSSEAESTVA